MQTQRFVLIRFLLVTARKLACLLAENVCLCECVCPCVVCRCRVRGNIFWRIYARILNTGRRLNRLATAAGCLARGLARRLGPELCLGRNVVHT